MSQKLLFILKKIYLKKLQKQTVNQKNQKIKARIFRFIH